MTRTPPNHSLQGFRVAGERRRRIRVSEDLVKNQPESAGIDESTASWPSRSWSSQRDPDSVNRDCNPCIPLTRPSSLGDWRL
jgi:hypothetical protein